VDGRASFVASPGFHAGKLSRGASARSMLPEYGGPWSAAAHAARVSAAL